MDCKRLLVARDEVAAKVQCEQLQPRSGCGVTRHLFVPPSLVASSIVDTLEGHSVPKPYQTDGVAGAQAECTRRSKRTGRCVAKNRTPRPKEAAYYKKPHIRNTSSTTSTIYNTKIGGLTNACYERNVCYDLNKETKC